MIEDQPVSGNPVYRELIVKTRLALARYSLHRGQGKRTMRGTKVQIGNSRQNDGSRSHPPLAIPEGNAMRISPLYVVFLSLLPMFSFAQCKKPAATLKVKIDASDSERKLLAEKLTKHGCNSGLALQFVETGFDYRILATDTVHYYTTIGQAGSGTAGSDAIATSVYDGAGKLLFTFERDIAMRLTHGGVVNATAKEIIKRIVQSRSTH
jgi:hypothetical protein